MIMEGGGGGESYKSPLSLYMSDTSSCHMALSTTVTHTYTKHVT